MDIDLLIQRIALNKDYTIGNLFINGARFWNTLEDTVRDIDKDGKIDNGEIKIHGFSAIPYGEYLIDMDTVSPKFSKYKQYKFCDGKLPRLIGVNGFDGVLIHIGNTPKDTEGCILVGKNTIKGQITESTIVFKELYAKLLEAHKSGGVIKIKII